MSCFWHAIPRFLQLQSVSDVPSQVPCPTACTHTHTHHSLPCASCCECYEDEHTPFRKTPPQEPGSASFQCVTSGIPESSSLFIHSSLPLSRSWQQLFQLLILMILSIKYYQIKSYCICCLTSALTVHKYSHFFILSTFAIF